MENREIAIVLANASRTSAIGALGDALELLVFDFDFGFRGWGAAMQILFDGERFDEDVIDEELSQSDLNAETVQRLASTYDWFILSGSCRLPGVEGLCSLDAILRPSLSAALPACVIFSVDSKLLAKITESEHYYDEEAAQSIERLSICLGAQPLVDGFRTSPTSSYSAVRPFDASELRSMLLDPVKVPDTLQEVLSTEHERPGFVTGIRSSLVAWPELVRRWPATALKRTTNGFTLLNLMGEGPPDIS